MNPSYPHLARPSRLALLLLAATQFVLVLDSAIVNVALPSMQADLDFTAGGVTWVVNAYALLFGGLLLFGGRLADVAGARRVFVAGLLVFVVASVVGALAPTAGALVAARAAQGLGAALTAPAAMALVMTIFAPGPRRNRALGLMGAAAGLGGASGAILGGLLTEAWGWPAILWINMPIGILIVVGALVRLPATPLRAARPALDLGGAITATGGLVAVVFGLIGVSEDGWLSIRVLLPLLAGVLLLTAFAMLERRAADPLLPPSLLAVRGLRGANLAVLLSAMAMMPMWFLLTVYLQAIRGAGPVVAGLGVLPTVAMLVLFNALAPRIIGRFGVRMPLAVGLLVAAVGLAWTSILDPQSSFLADLVLPQLVTGIGFGLAFVAGTVAATSRVPVERAGIAGGVYTTSQQVGGAIGLAVLAAVATGTGADQAAVLTSDLSAAFRVAAGFAAAAAVASWLLVPRADRGGSRSGAARSADQDVDLADLSSARP
ncbi:MFS transporter [Agromyces aurantiacus]|uniref:MFS transporter n=1 Tax=Agromyces aurantiacus TaxID=165814 RepID=A0ABV9R1J5_9MICO|nr:MFS transporter [Agromyces aurantiacus]MBM7505800.1 EmrB/QacA subfamily drug resistance transporter [Agromyces aurantiacus]